MTGLILFNAFENHGNVDTIDLPAYALNPTDSAGSGSGGASFRQTILGIEGSGPRIAGAKTSADVNIDFFGGLVTGNVGTSAGIVRMRTASVNLEWTHDSLQVGQVGPLISPLSPTSYATVAETSLAGRWKSVDMVAAVAIRSSNAISEWPSYSDGVWTMGPACC